MEIQTVGVVDRTRRGVSLGHPAGTTGGRLVVTLINEMIRRDVNLGLASLCAGGGMGYAVLLGRDF